MDTYSNEEKILVAIKSSLENVIISGMPKELLDDDPDNDGIYANMTAIVK